MEKISAEIPGAVEKMSDDELSTASVKRFGDLTEVGDAVVWRGIEDLTAILLHFVSCLKPRLIEQEHLENIKALKVESYIHRFLCFKAVIIN